MSHQMSVRSPEYLSVAFKDLVSDYVMLERLRHSSYNGSGRHVQRQLGSTSYHTCTHHPAYNYCEEYLSHVLIDLL